MHSFQEKNAHVKQFALQNAQSSHSLIDKRVQHSTLQKMGVIQREVARFSSLSEEQKVETANLFHMYKGLNGVYHNQAGEMCINKNPSTEAFINSILKEQDVRENSDNRAQLLSYLGIKLVEKEIVRGPDLSQFIGSTYSCLNGQLENILSNKTQGPLGGQTYNGSQMYHISGRYPAVGKPVWILVGNKVQIIGMYTHPGENFKEYKKLEGIGPSRFTIP